MRLFTVIRFCFKFVILSCVIFGQSSLLADTLSLKQVIELGLPLHPAVRAASGDLRVAKGNFWERISPTSPLFRIENEEVPRSASLSEYGRQTISLSQSFEFPFLTYYRGRAAHQTVQSARVNYELVRAEAKGEITMAYIDAWLLQKLESIADSLAQATKFLAETAEKRYTAGAATAIERDRLRARAEQFARKREVAELDFNLSLTELALLIGKKTDTHLDLTGPGLVDPNLPDLRMTPAASAQVQRSQFALKAARAEQGASRLSWLPQIELELFRQEDRSQRFWGGAIQLSLPVWFELSGTGNLKKTSGVVERAKAEVEQAQRQWQIDWLRTSRSFENAKRRFRSLEEIGLPAARRAYNAALRSYEVGKLGVTDLLATFLETQEAEREYLEVQREIWQWRTQIEVLSAGHTEQ